MKPIPNNKQYNRNYNKEDIKRRAKAGNSTNVGLWISGKKGVKKSVKLTIHNESWKGTNRKYGTLV